MSTPQSPAGTLEILLQSLWSLCRTEDLMDDSTRVLTAKGTAEQWGEKCTRLGVPEAQRRGVTLLVLHTLENC